MECSFCGRYFLLADGATFAVLAPGAEPCDFIYPNWHACEDCSRLVRGRAWGALLNRMMRGIPLGWKDEARQQMKEILDKFRVGFLRQARNETAT